MINNVEHKIALYADDILLYVCNQATSRPVLFDLLDTFGTYSGYKVNLQKTQLPSFHFSP